MPMTQAELDSFYEAIVVKVRARGGVCAITSGMACIEFGVAQTTKDCDLLCEPRGARILLKAIGSTELMTSRSSYRGRLSPPLDSRWLGGGWTSHFYWKAAEAEAYLDVFGIAPRGSAPWAAELRGLYASPHTVAEMKRTDRERDWPFATALGANMLDAGDSRGWLHIFDFRTLARLVKRVPCPREIVEKRPVLGLALRRDRRLEHALHVEKLYWSALDRVRLRVYERAVRPYAAAVRRARMPKDASLELQHEVRLELARSLLPRNPLREYGLPALVRDARAAVTRLVPGAEMDFLPDVAENFRSVIE
jgi:hypothetical protein